MWIANAKINTHANDTEMLNHGTISLTSVSYHTRAYIKAVV